MSDCIELARAFACSGRRIGSRCPVYLYGEAATGPARQRLADVRRGQYEGLKTQIGEPGREPDFGPAKLHPSAGAVAVGARPFLIAYNINLASEDVELAKRIARRIRESSGGLPKVQANGFWIEEKSPGPGLDEPARLPHDADLAGLGGGPGGGGRRRGRAGRVRADRARAPASLLDVADHAGFPKTASIPERLAAAANFLRLTRLLADAGPRAAAGSGPQT